MNRTRFAPIPDRLPATVPFTGPETLQRRSGVAVRARLGANESAFGPSPQAIAAMQQAAGEAWKYGDPDNHDLRAALAAHHGLSPDQIMVGEGIDGLLGYAVRLFLAPGEAVVTSDGAYPTFNYHVAGYGGVLHKVPYRDDAEDPEALAARAAEVGARLIYLANPDNPMGSWLPAARIEATLDRLPPGALLLLDEAYADFLPPDAVPQIAVDDPRVLRFRTFSKAYGLAGLRVGYVMGPAEAIAGFDRIRNHFGVGRVAQAGALAALHDQGWIDHIRAEVAAARDRIAAIGAESGLVALPAATNFVTMDCGGDGDLSRRIVAELAARGVFVRMPGVPPLDRCIRISAGPADQLDILEAALPDAVAAARA